MPTPWPSKGDWSPTSPPAPSSAWNWPEATTTWASLLRTRAGCQEAEAAHADALTITSNWPPTHPTPPEFRQELANSHNNLGIVFRVTGRLAEAEAAYADAVTIKKQLAADFPPSRTCSTVWLARS